MVKGSPRFRHCARMSERFPGDVGAAVVTVRRIGIDERAAATAQDEVGRDPANSGSQRGSCPA